MADLAVTRAGALNASDPVERLRQAADGFESFFVRELLRSAEGTGPLAAEREGLLSDSKALQQYRSLLYDGLAEEAAGGLGIADVIVNSMLASGAVRPAPADPPSQAALGSGSDPEPSVVDKRGCREESHHD